jgi:hypothetical protein
MLSISFNGKLTSMDFLALIFFKKVICGKLIIVPSLLVVENSPHLISESSENLSIKFNKEEEKIQIT